MTASHGIDEATSSDDDDDDDDDGADSAAEDVGVKTATATAAAAVAIASDDDDDDYASLKKPKAKPKPPVPTTTTAGRPTATSPSAISPSSSVHEVRNRFPVKSTSEQTDTQRRADLFGAAVATGLGTEKTNGTTGFAGTEAQLDTHRSEQESITDDLLQMAKLLHESSVTFGRSLESEKDVLQAAQEGLDRNTTGLQKTGRSLESLRRDENVSFIWSVIYMAAIAVLVRIINK